MYDPISGRFIERDAASVVAGTIDLYLYVDDQPTHAADPMGLEAQAAAQKEAQPAWPRNRKPEEELKFAQDKFAEANGKAKPPLGADAFKTCSEVLKQLLQKAQEFGRTDWKKGEWTDPVTKVTHKRLCCKRWTNAFWRESETLRGQADKSNCFKVERVTWQLSPDYPGKKYKDEHATIRITFADGSAIFLDDGQMMTTNQVGQTTQVFDLAMVEVLNKKKPGRTLNPGPYPDNCKDENLPK